MPFASAAAARSFASASGALEELRATWPPQQPEPRSGYVPLPLATMTLVDVTVLAVEPMGSALAVGLVANASGGRSCLPLVRGDSLWRVARAGDGVAAALVAHLSDADLAATIDPALPFALQPYASVAVGVGVERGIDSDQSNRSTVVDDVAIVKWRTSADADGCRALALRRHLAANGFAGGAPLMGALLWQGEEGEAVVLADIDGYLPGASDGWDHAIAALVDMLDGSAGHRSPAATLGKDLGALTADMHVRLSRPSALLACPTGTADRTAIQGWQAEALHAVEAAVAIETDDVELLARVAPALREEVTTLRAVASTAVGPLHGDLHLGQVVHWDGGLAYIDFDGPPRSKNGDNVDRQPCARDVAQMLCSLDNLAVVVDRRTEQRVTQPLRRWAAQARATFLKVYTDHLAAADAGHLYDARLLRAFEAEQLCRELLYAEHVLPRWRYAPLGALAWRYASEVE